MLLGFITKQMQHNLASESQMHIIIFFFYKTQMLITVFEESVYC